MLNWADIANLRRAADLLDKEAEIWEQGHAVYIEGEWRFPPESQQQEAICFRERNSARFLRDIANKGIRHMPADYQI